jgi:oxygen-independent coproporphyrinogen-3 oxidase
MTSLYIHIPFCIHRCGYCDFNTYAGLEGLIPAYSRAVSNELMYLSQSLTEPLTIHTIYFGGGTPSLIPSLEFGEILQSVRKYFNLVHAPEITIEANPGTVSVEYLTEVRTLGVNRISLGMQSAHQTELSLMDRQHTFEEVVKAVEWSRETGINSVNLDLIYGLPAQSLQAWMSSLENALSLHPDHLSLYALTLEHGTPMQNKVQSGVLAAPDPDLAADMYEAAGDRLADVGFVQYEISNWARTKNTDQTHACNHNLQYWRNLSYMGVGAGAHGFINHYRTVNIATPQAYINRLNNRTTSRNNMNKELKFPRNPATDQINPIDTDTEIGETMMMGLRLVQEGVSAHEFLQRFGISLLDRYTHQIGKLVSLGLLEWTREPATRLRLTSKGRLLGNLVFREFI